MMRVDPSLLVRRMVITRGATAVYDEVFHEGVNVIRGENSAGKSTILNFLFYALGGDVSEWSEVALICDQVTIEVALSGKLVTLLRNVDSRSGQPMDVYFGSYENSRLAPNAEWTRYPYRRSANKESFSQVMFRLLEIPEASNEASGNITLHQVMRLLYADQLSPVDSLFRFEQFDSAFTREAVGKLLCGAFDDELYSNGIDIREATKQFEVVSAELNSLYRALGSAGHSLNLGWVAEQRARVEAERVEIGNRIISLQSQNGSTSQSLSLAAQEEAYALVVEKQSALAEFKAARDAIAFEVADSNQFIASLREKLEALKDSKLAASVLGTAVFSTCPACYSVVADAVDGVCRLCKEPHDKDRAEERLASLINDTALQLRQSTLLQEHRQARLLELEAALEDAKSAWEAAARRYTEVKRRPTSDVEHKISELHKQIGYLDRREEDIAEKAKMIEVVESLSARKSELSHRLVFLRERNETLLRAQEARVRDAYNAISEKIRVLLMRDLRRQDSFERPNVVDFDFASNRISVDGQTYFSASSRAILKSSFFLGFHAAALDKGYFRHPRFCILDTIEDKGMEPARSQNFQREIARLVEGAAVRSQVIYATAMVAEELDMAGYTVGRFYTRDNPTLAIS